MRQILSYVCEQYFAGEAPNIKEYNIAVEALGRSADFDPNVDTIVRVEASRLRKRLREYYATEGADHPIQLFLSNTGYVPQFIPRPPAGAPSVGSGAEDAGPVQSPAGAKAGFPPVRKWMLFAVAGLVILALAALFPVLTSRKRASGSSAARTPVVQPASPVRVPDADLLAGDAIRILCGYMRPQFVDSLGRIWSGDRYFQGGATREWMNDLVGVTDPTMYRTARIGPDFRYDIPLKPGIYELHLLFVEQHYGKRDTNNTGEASRVFSVSVNGVRRFPAVDILADAGGPDIPADRVLKDISPADDGFLHLAFTGINDWACINGIEVLPGTPGKMRPVRIVAAGRSYYDRAGRFWGADRYFTGGRTLRRLVSLQGTDDPELYSNSRWGRFTYSIPVAPDSKYQLTLKFAETYYGGSNLTKGGVGSRMFDVYCNGLALLRNFDIYKEAGGENRPLDKVFRHLTPNGQGRLIVTFAPGNDYATVFAIEVIDEGK